MVKRSPPRAPDGVLKTAGKRAAVRSGTAFANYRNTPSAGLFPICEPSGNGWGGARNRAGRVNWHLSDTQVSSMVAAAAHAEAIGLAFNRHWIIHYQRAGIAEHDGARFISHLLRLVAAQARRDGGTLAAIWARESGDGKGGHVHILMHLPAGLSLRNRTRRWIVAAGGTYQRRVSRVVSIGGRLSHAAERGPHYQHNAARVRAYLLKGASNATGLALGLDRYGERGPIIGKRAGWTQNIGAAARHRAAPQG